MLLVVVFAGCGGGPTSSTKENSAANKVYEWNWVFPNAPSHPVFIVGKQYTEEIYKRTNGRLKITPRAMGELPFATTEYIRVVGDGSVQMGTCDAGTVSGDLKSGAIVSLPFLIDSSERLAKAMDSIKDPTSAEFGKYGVQLLMYFSYPQQQIWGSGKVPASGAGLKGLKIRSQGSEQSEVLRKMGISPVSITAAEVSTALGRGVADGLITAGMSMTGNGWYEYAKWCYVANLQAVPSYIVVNKKALDALPEDLRKIVLETADKWTREVYPKQLKSEEDKAFDILKNTHKLTFVPMSDAERKKLLADIDIGTYWREWAKKKGGTTPEDLNTVLKAIR
jgi:TRAP-type C4-dicarboxylate transport system substrate-binding protein